MEQSNLYAKAHAAYERGRWRMALLRALPLALLALISLTDAEEPLLTVGVTVVAAAAFVVLDQRGGALGAGARLGLIAGLVPFVTSLASRPLAHVEIAGMHVHGCVIMCAAASIGTMIALAYMARQRGEGRVFWIAATWTAVSVGAIACACVGMTGVGMLVGAVIAASLPVAVLRPLRQT